MKSALQTHESNTVHSTRKQKCNNGMYKLEKKKYLNIQNAIYLSNFQEHGYMDEKLLSGLNYVIKYSIFSF
jgi:hypothetical protein